LHVHWQSKWPLTEKMVDIRAPKAVGDPFIVDKYALEEPLTRN